MTRRAKDVVAALATVLAAAAALTVAVAALPAEGSSRSGGDAPAPIDLAAQAEEPAPIAVEMLTGRAVFPDEVALTLSVTLAGSPPLDLDVGDPSRTAVARITVQPGAVFPWHTHPGPVLVDVAEGELVYVPAYDCSQHAYATGEAFWDPGRGNVHTAFNPGDEVAVLVATFFEVPEEGPLTITEGVEAPAGCEVGPQG